MARVKKAVARAGSDATVPTVSGRASKAALLARRADTRTGFPEEEVDLPGLGTVLVRGLSRHEIMHLQAGRRSPLQLERITVALGMIDPPMTEGEVAEWQRVAVASEIDGLSKTIGRLSGMIKEPVKKAYKDFEADPGSEFRLLPGEGTEDDGSAPTGRDI